MYLINYMQLKYNNRLSNKTDSKFLSRNTLTALDRVRQNDNRQFVFTLTFEQQRIIDQANLFANYISATGIFENSFLNNSNRVNNAVTTIRNAYIYSYIKSVFYAYQLMSNNIASLMGPGSNTVFQGHKLMHDIICEGYIQHFTPPSNVISIELNPPQSTIAELQLFNLWPNVYDDVSGRVFNPELETVLNFLKTKCNSVIAMGNIAGKCSEEVRNLMQLPIGNMAYSEDMLQILYVEDEALYSDKISYFWNKAVLITAITVPPIDADDSIYDTVPTSSYDPNGLTFEVEAITGFNPLSGPRNAFDYTRNVGPSGNNPNQGSGQGYSSPRPPGGNPNSNSRRSNSNGPQNNPRSNQNTKLGMFKNRVSRLAEGTVNVIRSVDEVLTPERVQLLSDVIHQVTGKRPKIKTLKQHVGERLGKVLEDNGVSLNDRLEGSTEEYDAFYADSTFRDGRYETELIGTQKRITGKQ